MTYIRFFFVLYWFALFLKFGPLPPKNPRCAPDNDNNWYFLVAYSPSKPNYLIYKNKQKSCNLKLMKYKLKKTLNIIKCSRNFEYLKNEPIKTLSHKISGK